MLKVETVTADADQPHFSVSGCASDAYEIWIRSKADLGSIESGSRSLHIFGTAQNL
jgi:hypothetical protein